MAQFAGLVRPETVIPSFGSPLRFGCLSFQLVNWLSLNELLPPRFAVWVYRVQLVIDM